MSPTVGRSTNRPLYAVILAGGTGTRLWPRSRRRCPKQLLDIVNRRTMLQNTVDRVLPLIPAERIYIVTGAEYAAAVREQLPNLPADNILVEPAGRGTAPCIGLAASVLSQLDPRGIMISLHADHVIANPDRFRALLLVAAETAAHGRLVTLGIQPTYPETGYGYIERGRFIHRNGETPVYRVARFIEKPPAAQAAEYVLDGRHYWNSGLFVWRMDVILEAIRQHLPTLHEQLAAIMQAWNTPARAETLERVWGEICSVSIDVGIMEKADEIAVIPADIGWSDVGSWASLADIMEGNHEGNVILGATEHVGLETRDSLVYAPGRIVATIGMESMVVVDTGDVLLICPKSRAQDVRRFVDKLKDLGRQDLL